MEERNENLSYKPMKRYTTYPDENVADDPDNANIVLDNIDYLKVALNADNAGAHNSVFRGKDVTKYFDDGTLWTKISSGTFEDLFVGDYIVKNNITWRIAGFDYYLNKGQASLKKHHVVIVPDKSLTTSKMNESDDTTGGYLNSYMVTTTLPTILTTIEDVFGSEHILEYSTLLSNAVDKTKYNRTGQNNGASSEWEWVTRKIDLMSEIQIFGSIIFSSSGYDTGSMNTQLPLFKIAPEFICNRSWYWLKDILSGRRFCTVDSYGSSEYYYVASYEGGVRPFFFIG